MNITVGQFKVKSKDIKHNYNQMHALITQAISEQKTMIVFGEYALTGYGCASLFQQASFYDEVLHYAEKLKLLSKEITIIFGSVRKEEQEHFVTATVLHDDTLIYSDKSALNKREFDETLYFKSGVNIVFNDMLITFKNDGAQYDGIKVVLDSSPVNMSAKIENNTIYANTIGNSQVNKVIFINGGNSYIASEGNPLTFKDALSSGLLEDSFDRTVVSKLDALTSGIKNFSEDNFGVNKKWIVGNSGGLDSAVTIALLTIALGPKHVITYNLKSKFNSDKTVNNAAHLAKCLNIKHQSYSIEEGWLYENS